MGSRAAPCLLAVMVAACGGDAATSSPDPEPQPETCDVGELPQPDGTCLPPGVSACADGFAPLDAGCVPVLPTEPCPDGLMAVPGDTACRPPSPCGAAPWGDVPLEPGAVFVAASAPAGGDGSEASPLTMIQSGIDAAAPGAQVRVAEGDYVEDVVIAGKPLQLIGRCAELVRLRDASGPVTTVGVFQNASGTAVSGLSITGTTRALGVSGSTDVVLAGLRLHDTSNTALLVQDAFGPTSATLTDSLIERAGGAAALIERSLLAMDRVEIRDPIPNANGPGRGPNVQLSGELVLRQSVIRGTHDIALHLSGSSATVEASAFLDNLGRALNVQRTAEIASTLTVTQTVVDDAVGVSVFSSGSSITIADSVLSQARALDAVAAGWAVFAQDDGLEAPALLTLDAVLIDGFDGGGIGANGADVVVDRALVRGATGISPAFGRGVSVQLDVADGTPATLALTNTRIDSTFDGAVVVNGASATIANVQIRGVAPRPLDGAHGDGVVVSATSFGPVTVALSGSAIDDATRAGLAAFSSTISVSHTALRCNAIHINGEEGLGPFTVEDGGDNSCGCGDAIDVCKVLSSGLEPPAAVPSL